MKEEEIKSINPMIQGFLESDEQREAFIRYSEIPSEANLEKLNDAFKRHYVTIQSIAYFSKILTYEAKHFDIERRKRIERYPVILDAPTDGEEGTMKDLLVDENEIILDKANWEEDIEDEELYSLLTKLTDRQRETIRYSFFERMKDVEIARSTGVSPQAVSKTKREALRKMRRAMKIG